MAVWTRIYWNQQEQTLYLKSVDENGDDILELPQIRLDLTDLEYAGQVGGAQIEMICRRVHYTDAVSGAKVRSYGLFTIPELDDDDGHLSSTEDLYFGGGGGGGFQRMRVKAVFGDYLRCHGYQPQMVVTAVIHAGGAGYHAGDVVSVGGGIGTAATILVATIGAGGAIATAILTTPGQYTVVPDTSANAVTGGTGAGATFDLTLTGDVENMTDIWVAKMPDLRHSLASQTITSGAVTYNNYAIASDGTCTRTSHLTGQPDQNEMVLPVWVCGTGYDSDIFAEQPSGGTGAIGDGASGGCPTGKAITWLVKDSRCWSKLPS